LQGRQVGFHENPEGYLFTIQKLLREQMRTVFQPERSNQKPVYLKHGLKTAPGKTRCRQAIKPATNQPQSNGLKPAYFAKHFIHAK
jgi:hypothetical protein